MVLNLNCSTNVGGHPLIVSLVVDGPWPKLDD